MADDVYAAYGGKTTADPYAAYGGSSAPVSGGKTEGKNLPAPSIWQRMGIVPSDAQVDAAGSVNSGALEPGQKEDNTPGTPGDLLMHGLSEGSKAAGKFYVKQGPMQAGSGVADIARGDIAKGGHKVISGAGVTMLPIMPELIAANPIMAARAMAGGYVGSKGAEVGAQALGANEDQAKFAGDLGNLAGGTAAASGLPRALLETPFKKLAVNNRESIGNILEFISSPKTVIKSKLTDMAKQFATPAKAEGTASGPVEAPIADGPTAKMRDVQSLNVQPGSGPKAPQNLLQMPGKPMRGPQGEFDVNPPQAAPAPEARPTLPEENIAVKPVTPGSKPGRIGMGEVTKQGEYQVAPITQGGKEVGRIVYQVDGDRGIIHWVGDAAMENSLSNQLGPLGIKQLFLKFSKANPEVKTLEGIRVGGANGEEALTKKFDVSELYGKSPQPNLVPTHQRQLAGDPGRVGVTHYPAPGENMPTDLSVGPNTQPTIPVNDNHLMNLLMESLRRRQAQ